jgi:Zn-dependent M28 family amino/carboxypeptidase
LEKKTVALFLILAGWGWVSYPAPTFSAEALFRYQDVLWRHLETLCGFGARNPGSRGYEKAKAFIAETGRRYADEVVLQQFEHRTAAGDRLALQNIEMRFKGGGGRPILIGAHYDTRPFADEEPDPAAAAAPILGANDGGSGAAVLLALAEYLREKTPPVPATLVFFDGEDYGVKGSSEYFLGSKYYAGKLRETDKSVWPFAALVVDMVGDKDLRIFQESVSVKSAPWLVEIIFDKVARRKRNFPQFVAESRYSVLDDHYPFYQIDIPAALLIDFDYPHWHKLSDTLDKCSPESLLTVFTVVADMLEELRGMERR